MKRTVALVLGMGLLLSACIPTLPQLQPPTEAPVIDMQATDAAMAQTQAAETLNALPTSTLEPATDTPEPTATDTELAAFLEEWQAILYQLLLSSIRFPSF